VAAEASAGPTIALLGPLEVYVAGRPVALTTGRLRTMLAVLAMSAGETVAMDRLIAELWDGGQPAHARRAVQTYASRLRGVLGNEVVRTTAGGYVLRIAPEQVDALRFLRLLDAAARSADPAEERARLIEALRLWRSQPFEGIWSAWLENTHAPRLVERFLEAAERRVDLDIADGRYAGLAAYLGHLVARYPLRESLWARLLVVLGRSGRQAEALEHYETIRVRLAEELGSDPGAELQRVYADLLAGRPPALGDAAVAPAWRVPRQLPPDVADFAGRDAELARLHEVLTGAGQHAPAAISAIQGIGGIGKSALAIRAAHELAEHFPDGQLYVDLHGATTRLRPLEPLEVLGRFLRALDADPAAIPSDLEEAAGMFRSRVAGRRLLVVLDNAADAAQVRPLLPASPGCAVLVTSRRALVGLDGATHVQLDALAPEEALELLRRLAGSDRVDAAPEAAMEVARCCGYLPLALRIAGARLAVRPTWPLKELAERLGDQQRRLDELELADTGVRASFQVSHEQLRASRDRVDRSAAKVFGLLGVLDGAEIGTPVVARLLDAPEMGTEAALERLVDTQLLQTPSPGRYRLHDLLRLYARELARRHHSEREQAAALTRALEFYVATAWHTFELLRPGDYRLTRVDERWRKGGLEFEDEQSALEWLEAERANLVAAVRQAAATPGLPGQVAIQLAQGLAGFFWVRSYLDDRVQVNQIALGVARRDRDLAAQAQAHNELGAAYSRQGRFGQALASHQESLTIRRELGDRRGQAASLNNLGLVHERQGHDEEALACHQQSLTICRELGDRRGQAASLGNLGAVCQRLGRYEEALACLQESLAVYRKLGDRRGQATSLDDLGAVCQRLGRYEEALACLQESLAICRDLGEHHIRAYGLNDLGLVYRRLGRYEEALASLRESLAIRRELGDPHGQAETLRELGLALRALGRQEEARAQWLEALNIFEQLRTINANQIRTLLAESKAS
jgi:DNA-binding SARP family transcriptional activator/Flp pilus assembly protein TadD